VPSQGRTEGPTRHSAQMKRATRRWPRAGPVTAAKDRPIKRAQECGCVNQKSMREGICSYGDPVKLSTGHTSASMTGDESGSHP
jgi:hypothetical protein